MTILTTAPAPTGAEPTADWASGITSEIERRELAWLLAQHANQFLAAASDENVTAHTASVPEALHLGCGLMGCCTDAQDAYADLTGRLPELDDTAPDPLAIPCPRPGCTHDRGSHLNGTGSCGYCGCPGFAGEQVTFAEIDAQGSAA